VGVLDTSSLRLRARGVEVVVTLLLPWLELSGQAFLHRSRKKILETVRMRTGSGVSLEIERKPHRVVVEPEDTESAESSGLVGRVLSLQGTALQLRERLCQHFLHESHS